MKWPRIRIRGRNRRQENTADEQAERRHQADGPRPRLMLLVCDAFGPGAYRLHTFEDATSALAFVQFWFPKGVDRGIIAFWAAHQEPVWPADSQAGAPAEAVILIRDEVRPGIVYPFSLSSMGLAHSWIAKEAAHGLNLRQVLLYWAAPVRIGTDRWGRLRLTPREPPSLRRPVLLRSRTVVVRRGETPSRDPHRRRRTDQRRRAAAETDVVADAAQVGEAAEAREGRQALEGSDILKEVERLVQRRQRRWMRKERPFRGFGSPPGKF